MKITTDVPSSKLTPQRKHRKLLKSGEGEVWSEDVEKVFVQGLHQYWESPWATYSRGRSRWRNQFLVDYLARAGIERTKKQVASHVQVLRNMWKGEKEYHLVAGGEELFLETGLFAPVKQEEADISALSPADTDESSPWSPLTPSTNTSPLLDYPGLLQMPPENAQPGSPALSAAEPIALPRLMATARSRSSSLPGLHRRYTAPTPSPLAPRPASFGFEQQPSPRFYPAATPPAPAYPDSFGEPQCQFLDPPPPPAPIRLSSINLYAEGMPPFTFSLDSVLARAPRDQPAPRLLIQIRVRLPSIDDVHACPTLHGVLGAATFTRAWAGARAPSVVTDVYAGGVHTSRESGALLPAGAGACAAGTLPESELTRCRWLDSSKETSVYQRIIADGETMAVVVYSLDRSPNHDQLPFAEVVAVQKYRVNEKPAAQQACSQYPAPAATPAPYYSEPQASAPRYPAQTSLSCALTAPAYTHAAPNSMLL